MNKIVIILEMELMVSLLLWLFQGVSINYDDFVKEQNFQQVDFIKMDIAGAELCALEGCEYVKKLNSD